MKQNRYQDKQNQSQQNQQDQSQQNSQNKKNGQQQGCPLRRVNAAGCVHPPTYFLSFYRMMR